MRWRTVRRVAATASVGLVVPVAVASAGMLDGRPATSHRLGPIGLRRTYPAVRWQDEVRDVDDGDLITTAGVLLTDGVGETDLAAAATAAARASRACATASGPVAQA